jgi:hypothetical protein
MFRQKKKSTLYSLIPGNMMHLPRFTAAAAAWSSIYQSRLKAVSSYCYIAN